MESWTRETWRPTETPPHHPGTWAIPLLHIQSSVQKSFSAHPADGPLPSLNGSLVGDERGVVCTRAKGWATSLKGGRTLREAERCFSVHASSRWCREKGCVRVHRWARVRSLSWIALPLIGGRSLILRCGYIYKHKSITQTRKDDDIRKRP